MRQEIALWRKQGEADLAAARTLLEDGIHYASVFFSQQAAEKLLKAAWILQKRELPPKTHNLVMMARNLGAPERIIDEAAELSPEYFLTRYPNVDVGIPEEIYTRLSAERHLKAAEAVREWTETLLVKEE